MAGRPMVSLILPPPMVPIMFRAGELDRLRQVADVFGPFDRTDLSGLTMGLQESVAVITGWGSPRFDSLMLSAAPKLRAATSPPNAIAEPPDSAASSEIRLVASTVPAKMGGLMEKRLGWSTMDAHNAPV